MHGADVGRMVISVNSDIVIWSADGDQGSDWKLGRITIPAPEIKYDLTLTAEANEGHGNVALDDIFVEQLPCFLPNKYYCDFNYSIEECSFTSNAEVGQIMLTKLYELQPFDPIIVNEIPQSSKVLTYVENVTFIQHPVIMTPVLPALTSFYPAYCLNVQ
uniref:MAM domain-containing protein n=1 Tax=Ciona savignyi TaxID=51511 RepID=H2Y853_CIOSA